MRTTVKAAVLVARAVTVASVLVLGGAVPCFAAAAGGGGGEGGTVGTDYECERASGDVARDEMVIGFGSCNKPDFPQTAWQWMDDTDLFLFNGDVVYSATIGVDGLEKAFDSLDAGPAYQRVKQAKASKWHCRAVADNCEVHQGIWSTWDDHDFGINDGGGGEPLPIIKDLQVEERLRVFKEHMHPRCTDTSRVTLSSRNGTYHSTKLHVGDKRDVVISLLDTRTHRQLHAIPSLGTFSFIPLIGKLFPITAGATRMLAANLGWGNTNRGAMLGEEQWRWLENTLCSNNDDDTTHIIVSSIQVLTSNPLVESWGHFPTELQRLLSLLDTCNLKHAIIVSGDVHFTEFTSLPSGQLVEVTSSGMTHDCTGGVLPRALCSLAISTFGHHRSKQDTFHPRRAFAKMRLHWRRDGAGGDTDTAQAEGNARATRDADGGGGARGPSAVVEVIASEDGQVVHTRRVVSLASGRVYGNEANQQRWGVIHRPPVPLHMLMVSVAAVVLAAALPLLAWCCKRKSH
ncbi:hypothetical protein PTSG_12174 [Salpingoeca rosetta]|uniref:PhoD-like phosphatase metallophosphatase domain-containing protein n=1 Tax=Salpingoeca rosetta (strain ATCC 50818 / BSB-021) TaxID=946362 RepID=F2U8I0_SALR5|nr:uncharacterized protein PTSG_12174 [Salpingoeca rosetta]EGD72688.1 hypothetical protein PTSG_12174 [Salpingoeca rosetta]|eukprot:XP_004994511.1 hypothetical protein PTSG_12174 [Salpingoeca rosetta]